MKKDRYFYPAVFGYEPDEEISVFFPDLDVATSGTNDDDALVSARELLGAVLAGLEEDGEDIPEPTPLHDVAVGENERTVLIDVYMPAIRLANVNKSVNRTVTLPPGSMPPPWSAESTSRRCCRRHSKRRSPPVNDSFSLGRYYSRRKSRRRSRRSSRFTSAGNADSVRIFEQFARVNTGCHPVGVDGGIGCHPVVIIAIVTALFTASR